MATHIKDVRHNGHCYFICHVGEQVYYSKLSRGVGTTTIRGLKYRNGKLILANGKEPEKDEEIVRVIIDG